MTPSPNFKHQDISRKLTIKLDQYVQENHRGLVLFAPFDVVLGEDVVQPDILFVAQKQIDIVHEEAIHGAPNLIIEILSPSTAERDRTYKNRLYARHGVQEYWLVDPEAQTVEVLHLTENGYQQTGLFTVEQNLHSKVLNELRIALNEIF